jgi:hypothetical protein
MHDQEERNTIGSRRTRRREELATKTDSELTNETTQSTFSGTSFGSRTTTEEMSQHAIHPQNSTQHNALLYRQASYGPSGDALDPPPRLMRETSSESNGSAARKRSIHDTPAVQQWDFGGLDDEELIREQHEIMKQIQQEQNTSHRLNRDDEGKPNQSIITTCAHHKKDTITAETTTTVPSVIPSPLWYPMASTPLSHPTLSTDKCEVISSPVSDQTSSSFSIDMFIDDPNMMQEQQQIMDEIMRQRATSTAKVPFIPTSADCSLNNTIYEDYGVNDHVAPQQLATRKPMPKTSLTTNIATRPESSQKLSLENAPLSNAFACIPRPLYTKPSSIHSQVAINTSPAIYNTEEDSLVDVYGEKSLRIKGTRHTWKEIELGRAIIVQCPCCSTFLQVSRKATLLFCTKCEEISPIVIHQGKSTSDDSRIARVVQHQESQVAYSRKILKGGDTSSHSMR